jgi:hypothetical protein
MPQLNSAPIARQLKSLAMSRLRFSHLIRLKIIILPHGVRAFVSIITHAPKRTRLAFSLHRSDQSPCRAHSAHTWSRSRTASVSSSATPAPGIGLSGLHTSRTHHHNRSTQANRYFPKTATLRHNLHAVSPHAEHQKHRCNALRSPRKTLPAQVRCHAPAFPDSI